MKGGREQALLAALCMKGEVEPMNTGYLWLLGTALSWSFSGVFTKLNSQPGFLISAVSAVASLLFYFIIVRPTIHVSKLVVAAAASSYCMGITFVYANKLTSVGSAIVLQYSSMAFVALFEAIEQRKIPPARKILVIVMALAGMVVFFFDSLSAENVLGNLLAIVSGAFFGLMFFLNAKPGSSPVTSSMMSSTISLLPGLFFVPQLPQVKPLEWGLMAAGGIMGGISNLCFARGIVRVQPLTANLITMLEVVFAPIWAFLFFGESFGRFALVGTVLIIGSIVVNLVLDQRAQEAERRDQEEPTCSAEKLECSC